MAQLPPVAIVGCGRTGGSIGLALQRAGHTVSAAWSATPSGRARARSLLRVAVPDTAAEAATSAPLVMIAVPDDAVEKVALEIAHVCAGRLVVHTSGATSVRALDSVTDAGGRTGCVHPLQTLPEPELGASALSGAYVAITCDETDRPVLWALAKAWGSRPFVLPDDAKVLYHAAAVFASNHIATAVASAVVLLEQAGIDDGEEVVRPLVEASARNAGRPGSMTGPAVRGDAGTIAKHAHVLRDTPFFDAYRAYAVLAARLGGGDRELVEEASR